ncbi:MAG TPA: zf-HC2 domain-containing protein [Streptosporangiaceae bacterium]
MTGAGVCGEIRRVLGVYVLGAIDPAGRALVDMHLAWCRDCREELAGLASLPALLGRVSAAEAEGLARDEAGWDSYGRLPAESLPRLLEQTVRIRSQRRWRGVAVAAAALAIVASGSVAVQRVLSPAGSLESSQASWKTVSSHNHVTLARATVDYGPQAWGTKMDVHISGIPAGTACQVWVVNSRGQETAAGSWTVSRDHQDVWYPASASLPASDVRGFEITAGGKDLVTVPAA